MKKLLKSKLFIGITTAFIVLLLAFLFLYMLLGNDLFGGTAEIISKILATQIHWYVLGIVGGLAVLTLLILFVLPFMLYVLIKIFTYLSLLLVCLKERLGLKITRVPFASICGVKEKADLEIKMNDNKICVHFIDVPLGFRKMLTVINENNYQISSSSPGGVRRIGGHPGGNFSGGQTAAFFGRDREVSDENNKYKSIPKFESNNNEFHYFVVSPGYVDAKVVVGNGTNDISAETPVGKITICKYKTLKRRLKNQLYTPMNGNSK